MTSVKLYQFFQWHWKDKVSHCHEDPGRMDWLYADAWIKPNKRRKRHPRNWTDKRTIWSKKDFITCKCKKTSRKNNVCNCWKSKLPCSGLCEYLLYENNEVNEDISDEYAESDDSTDDDFDESDAVSWFKMMLLLWLMAKRFDKYN